MFFSGITHTHAPTSPPKQFQLAPTDDDSKNKTREQILAAAEGVMWCDVLRFDWLMVFGLTFMLWSLFPLLVYRCIWCYSLFLLSMHACTYFNTDIQIAYSPHERNHIYIMFPREIMVMDVSVDQVRWLCVLRFIDLSFDEYFIPTSIISLSRIDFSQSKMNTWISDTEQCV